MPILREALAAAQKTESADLGNASKPVALVIESNSLMHFVKPSLFFAVLDPAKEDFKDSARAALDRADALVVRGEALDSVHEPLWMKLPSKLLREKPSVNPREGEPLPEPLEVLVRRALEAVPAVKI